MPEVHRFWYSSPLICSTHFLGQISLIPDYLDLQRPKFHVSYRPLTLGQTLILNILDYQFRRKIVNPLRFCSFFQFYDIYSIYELFYIQYIALLLNIVNNKDVHFKIIQHKTHLLSCFREIDSLQRICQLCQSDATVEIHVGYICINNIPHQSRHTVYSPSAPLPSYTPNVLSTTSSHPYFPKVNAPASLLYPSTTSG